MKVVLAVGCLEIRLRLTLRTPPALPVTFPNQVASTSRQRLEIRKPSGPVQTGKLALCFAIEYSEYESCTSYFSVFVGDKTTQSRYDAEARV